MSRIRNVALLLLVLALATGLASAQPGIHVTQIGSSGSVTQTSYDPSTGPAAKAPRAGEYWDAQTDTDYFAVPAYINAPPNPQIAVGPDDIITIVNRTVFRYPNPNALGNSLVTNPYGNSPTSRVYVDTWLGVSDLNSLCPTVSPARTNATCVIDNASTRYDQLQGRYVVLFTVTDLPSHISNFVLIVSRTAQFTQGTSGTTQVFTPPIAPIVGGTSTGGQNANWFRYIIPVNVVLPGTVTNGTAFCVTPNVGGNPASLPLPNTAGTGPITSGCSDYFPTGARMGMDNDNIILTAPVLDQSQAPFPPSSSPAASAAGVQQQLPGGPYAGTRVVTLPKMAVYNGAAPALTGGANAYNLADDTATGTLTGTTGNPAASIATNPIPAIFWEPDNLRGRALASFDAQVGALSTTTAGVIAPLDYLVGTQITNKCTTADTAASPCNIGGVANTTGGALAFWVQPVIFTCGASAIYAGPSGVTFCGIAGAGQVAEVPVLGVMVGGGGALTQLPRTNVASIAVTGDPALVGQSNANDGTSMVAKRLYVGDSRPQQVMFREGLLYIARAVRLYDSLGNPLGTSTVDYDVLHQPGPTCGLTGNAAGAACTQALGGNPYSVTGNDIPFGSLVLESYWYNGQNTTDPTGNINGFGFYSPMYDVPANVINNSQIGVTGGSPISPINLFPWLEKLFVGMTTGETTNVSGTFAVNHPSLWDFRPGDDAYDTALPFIDPYTGVVTTAGRCNPSAGNTACGPAVSNPIIPFGTRGGAQTDPNDGSLWLYGAFGKQRLGSIPGPGHWGTSVANYQLDFPTVDPYGNDNSFYADVQPGNLYFTWVQIAKNIGITPTATTSTVCNTSSGTNPPILQPPSGGGSPSPGTSTLTCLNFGPDVTVTRSEMARWIVLSQMDEAQINTYLAATGGFPGCGGLTGTSATPIGSTTSTVTCGNGIIAVNFNGTFAVTTGTQSSTPTCSGTGCTYGMNPTNSSFGDPPKGCATGNVSCTSGSNPYVGILNDPNIRYIETLYRRGYTKGCSASTDPIRRFCGGDFLTRAQMSVFIIRAKMNNVFPTTLSGVPLCLSQGCGTTYGDNFGLFSVTTPYFPVDVPSQSDPTFGDYYIFIQKMRELRISNGVTAGSPPSYAGGFFGAANNITRKEVAVFVVKAFFL